MSKFYRAPLLMLGLMLSGQTLFAQQSPAATAKNEAAPPAVVVQSYVESLRYEDDGTGVGHVQASYLITSQAGVQKFGLLAFPYPKATDTLTIDYVRVRKPDGTVIPTSSDLIDDMPAAITRQAPEYSDIREKQLAVKSLAVGDTLEYAYTERIVKPLDPGQFWVNYDFTRDSVIKSQVFELNVPRDRELHVKSRTVQPTIQDQGNRRIYTWKWSNPKVEKQPLEKLQPPPDVLVSTFKTWDDVGKWWASLATARAKPTPEIEAKVAALTKDAKTEDEKVRILYDYVSTHFRYIGVSFGIGRFQPHAAGEVLENGYGDCKDKDTLLTAMLQVIGVHAYSALLNTARRLDPDVPSPAQFDHVITVVPLDGKQVFLDTTTEVGPFGYLMFPIRGAQTLLVPPSGPAVLGRTPADLPYPAKDHVDVNGKLSASGVFTATFTGTFRSDREVLLRAIFFISPPSKWKEVMQAFSYAQGFGGTISHVVVSDPGDLDTPFHYSYDYTRKDYSDWKDHQITPPLPMTGMGIRDDPTENDAPQTGSIQLGGLVHVRMTSEVQLPGFTVKPPAPVHLSTDFADYSSESTFKNGVLDTTRTIDVKETEIPVSHRPQWDKFRRGIYDDENNYIDLTSTTTTTTTTAKNSMPSTSAQAEQLVQQAANALQQRDVNTARRMVDQALHLDPTVWNGYLLKAQIDSFTGGGIDTVIAELRKEIQLHPTNEFAYRILGSTLTYNRPDEVHALWEQMVKAMPDNPDANFNLAGSEYDLGHYDLAAEYYAKALTAYSDNAAVITRYADALIKSGQAAKAVPLLEKAVTLDPSPATLNSAALALADANVKFDEAMKFATQAAESAEKKTAEVSLDSLTPYDFHQVQSLASDWDTLGWIYFKQGNVPLAEKFLLASWSIGGDAPAAEHLGQLEEKKGNRAAALRYYKMSYSLDANATAQAALTRLTGHKYTMLDVNGERSRVLDEYTHAIPRGTSSAEFATYYILVKPDGTLAAVHWVSGSKKLEPYLKHISGLGFPTLGVPNEPAVRIVRRAEFLCDGYNSKCKLTIYPARLVTSVN